MTSAAFLTVWILAAAVQLQAAEQPQESMTPGEAHRLVMTGSNLTDDQVNDLEATLARDPDDLPARVKLLGYYWRQQFASAVSAEAHSKHALYIIRHYPASPVAGLPMAEIHTSSMPDAGARAREAWLKNVENDPENVAILMNAARFFTMSDRPRAIVFVIRATTLDPDKPELLEQLGLLYKLDARGRGGVDAEAARRSLEAYEGALARSAARKRYYMLADVAEMALLAGDPEKAKKYSTELLNAAVEATPDWNYGNAVHHGNLILGRVALSEGDIDAAERYLLKAGKTPGSPQLNSFGPNMMLARTLLEAGRKEAVIEYLRLCGKFWKKGILEDWIEVIEEGGMPEFGANLRY